MHYLLREFITMIIMQIAGKSKKQGSGMGHWKRAGKDTLVHSILQYDAILQGVQ